MLFALKNNLETEPNWERLIEKTNEYLKLKEEWNNKTNYPNSRSGIARVKTDDKNRG